MKVIGLLEEDDKERALRQAADGDPPEAADQWTTTSLSLEEIAAIPSSPFAYWVGPRIRELFTGGESFETPDKTRTAKCGLGTLDDFRFLRLGWECDRSIDDGPRWRSYFHGGVFSRFYDVFPLVVNWARDGAELRAFVAMRVGSASRKVQSSGWYFEPGFVFSRRTRALAPKIMPAGGIFSTGGQAGFVPSEDLFATLAILNSSTCSYLIALTQGRTGGAAQYEVGQIQRMPWVHGEALWPRLGELGRVGWALQRALHTAVEASEAFTLPALLQTQGESLRVRTQLWFDRTAQLEQKLGQTQAEIDELCFALYELPPEDRRAITERFGVPEVANERTANEVEEPAPLTSGEPRELAAHLLCWAVSVAVGRFDVRLATGDRALPTEPNPIDPLPTYPPASLIDDDGSPLVLPPTDYPVKVSPVLVTDPGHPLDISLGIRSVFEVVFGPSADDWWTDVSEVLGARGGEPRQWLAKGLFDYHLRGSSMSRRKAPVLWPLGTPSGSYLVWLYAHGITSDSLFRVLHDIVTPKVTLEDQRLTRLRQEAGPSAIASQRREIERQAAFVDELRELAEALESVAPLWAPDLNDGIVVVLAPLWRLFAHHRAWSKELKAHWEKLGAGDYDWAQLAMRLWPERVIPKCAEDRSLAIAHQLEDVFWVQDEANADKWHPRNAPTTPVDELVARHHNPAVLAALARLS